MLLAIVLLLYPQSVTSQPSPVTAAVDRTTLSMNERVNLTVTVTGSEAGQPQIPVLDGFQIVGTSSASQIRIINGAVSSQVSYRYTLQPTRVGQLVIAPVQVVVDGQTVSTDPITVEVTQGTTPSQQAPGTSNNHQAPNNPSTSTTETGDIFVEAEVDSPTPYLSEQITYTFRLYQAVRFFGQPSYAEPEFTGFWNQQETAQKQYNIQISNRPYQVTELTTILFPTVIGERTIEPALLSIPGSLLSAGTRLSTEPVTVQPLPVPAPDGFTGAVGQVEIFAEADIENAAVNEPITLRVMLRGSGNIQTWPDPELPDLPNWRKFDSTSSVNTRVQNGRLIGQRVIEQLLVPTAAGEFTIPALSYTYFDPITEEYRTVSTEPRSVIVAEGVAEAPLPIQIGSSPEAVQRLVADIRHIQPVPASLAAFQPPITQSLLYWLAWTLPLLLLVIDRAWSIFQRKRMSNPDQLRRSQAYKKGRNALAQLRRKQAITPASVGDVLLNYLSDKLNQPIQGMTRTTLRTHLGLAGVDPSTVGRVETLLNQIDMARYAPTDGSQNEVDGYYSETETLITDLERVLVSAPRSTTAQVSAILLTLICSSFIQIHAQTSAAPSLMERGNQLYENEQYAEAAQLYTQVLESGVMDSALYYNLGNAYYKQGNLGNAILNYERAMRIAPRDPDIRANLTLARSQILDQYESANGAITGRLADLVAAWLTVNETAILSLVLWVLVALILLVIWHGWLDSICTGLQYLLAGCILLLLVSVTLLGTRIYADTTRPPAIILAQEVDVVSGPGEQYITEFTLHSGAKVSVLEERGAWVRLALPGEQLQGWVMSGVIERIGL